MSIEKMRLVRISGDSERLNETLAEMLDCGCFQPEPAGKYFSESLGLFPYNEENPYAQVLSEMQSILKDGNHTPSFTPEEAKKPLTEDEIEHINSLFKRIDDTGKRRSELIEQKEKCEDGIKKFSHFTGLSVNLDEITELSYVKVRFGHMPKESVNKLDAVFKRCPYFYFVPCSTDQTDYWGAYFAPKNRIDEVDGIFAMLLFEPFKIPAPRAPQTA